MSTSKVTVRFTNLNNLWAFRLASAMNKFEMNLAELSITSCCSKEQIELAIKEFNGKIVATVNEEV